MTNIHVRPATSADLGSVESLIHRNGLPVDGVAGVIASTIIAHANGRPIGCAALEVYPSGVLLRSVAVDEAWRGRGIGRQLTEAALTLARSKGATAAFLLTTTAETFFQQFGFTPLSRADVPDDVKQSVEFRYACPSSAVAMRAYLGGA